MSSSNIEFKTKKEDLPKSSFNAELIKNVLLGWNIKINNINYNTNIKNSDILQKNPDNSFNLTLPNEKDFYNNKTELITFLKKLYIEFYGNTDNDVFENNSILLDKKFSSLKKYSSKKTITSLSKLSTENIQKDFDIAIIELGKIQILKNFKINGISLQNFLTNEKEKGQSIKEIMNKLLKNLRKNTYKLKKGEKDYPSGLGIPTEFVVEQKTFCVNSVYLSNLALEFLGKKSYGLDGGKNNGKLSHIMLLFEDNGKKYIIDNRRKTIYEFDEINKKLINYNNNEFYIKGDAEKMIFSNTLFRQYLKYFSSDFNKAKKFLLKSYEINPKNMKSLYELARIYKKSKPEISKYYSKKLKEINPNFMKSK